LNKKTTDFALAPREQLAAGSRYQLLARIAAGGMATVYIGRLREAGAGGPLVAVKRAHPHLVRDPVFARMFLAEARLASRIHHPNVVQVRDVEQVEGELLLVMDYVEGGSLSDLLNPTGEASLPLDPAMAVRIVLDAAGGLDAAHDLADENGVHLGVVHRDVSPQNILVGTDGVARIADFGIAKPLLEGTSATVSMGLKGKFAYMAPEYVRHEGFDARSDVFALGVVAWEALTGKRLFRAANEIATLKLLLGMAPRRPSDVRPGLPPALDDVVLRALDKLPEGRWPTACSFAVALQDAASKAGLVASHLEVGSQVSARVGDALHEQQSWLSRKDDATALEGPGSRRRPEYQEGSLEPSYHTASLPYGITLTPPSPMVITAPPLARSPERRYVLPLAGLALGLIAAAFAGVTIASAHVAPPAAADKPLSEEVSLTTAPPLASPPATEPTTGQPATLSVEDLPLVPRRKPAAVRVEARPHAWVRAPKRAPHRNVAAPNPYGPAP
jgi:serine/threonine protein kinase